MEKLPLREIRREATLLEEQKSLWMPKWQETARWVAPWRGRFSSGDSLGVPEWVTGSVGGAAGDGGGVTDSRILDATATRAVRILAAGLQSGLTSPARPWFRLRRSGDDAVESGPERRWLDVVEETLYAVLAGSNFYQAVHGLYTELAVFGSATMYVEADPERIVRCATLNCGEFSWAADASGRIDTVLRRLAVTPRQAAQLWGTDTMSHAMLKLLETKPDAYTEVFHLVKERTHRNPRQHDRKNMRYASLVWEQNASATELLHEGGFEEFPFLCARWDVLNAELYGRSPAMDALPDVRMLQEMTKSQLLAIHKVVNPPMRVPAGFKQRLSLIPGAINYINPNQPDGIGPLYQISPDLGALSRKIEDVRDAVRQGFFNDLFLMFAGDSRSHVTAAEVMERGQEKLLMLGPVIERHQTEILDPLLVRVFGIVSRAGLLPAPPPALEGKELRVEYVSALAQAQRLGGADAIRRLTAEVASLAAVSPQVLDKIDFDQAVDELAMISGVSSRVVRSDAEVAELRKQRDMPENGHTGAAIGETSLEDVLASVPGLTPEVVQSVLGALPS